MAVTQANIDRVRSLTGVTVTDFDDEAIEAVIELYACVDADGLSPDDVDWAARYDLYRAAADITEQRVTAYLLQYDTTADGATMARSQMVRQLREHAQALRSHGYALVAERPNDDTTTEDDEDE